MNWPQGKRSGTGSGKSAQSELNKNPTAMKPFKYLDK